MKTRFYLLGLLLAVSAFMTAFVITAQQDAPIPPAKPAAPVPPVEATPAPAPDAPQKVEDELPPAAQPETPETATPKAEKPEAVPIPIPETITKEGADSGFVQVVSETGEVKGAKIVASRAAGKINLTLDDVEMVDVARMFTKIAEANILYNPTNLRGRVTVNFTDVEWKPALESILGMHQLALTETPAGSGVYTIAPQIAGAEPLVVATYFLNYATVPEVQALLAPVVGQGGTISPFPSRNALIVRATAPTQAEIKKIVSEVDKFRKQAFIEAKFLELNDQAIRDLGVNWQVLQGYNVSVGSLNWSINQNREWADSHTENMKQWDRRANLDTQDKRYKSGVAAGGSTSYDPASGTPAPASLAISAGEPTRAIVDTIYRGKTVDEAISFSFTKNIADIRTAVLGADAFGLVLSALKQMNGVSIVSNPKIIVANEQSATIHIGMRERPFVSTVTPATTMSAPIVTYNPGDPVDLGVKLIVTPTVNTDTNITLKIDPELTRFVKNAVAPNGQTYPIITTKRISTIFCLESGKTVAIGGLTETEDRDRENKVPLLGDIPIIGKYLFTHSHKEKSQQETIIFVTVGVANPDKIQSEDGLPDETELARQHILSREINKAKFTADMEDLNKNADEKKQRGATAPSRLLKRQL
ncbi:MAG: secretin N-terminal domain-containing protein [Verrucomicrobiota bacterium]|nr:secretin N-terminal domain-containing protein [Verrucomicrobiota bacterium]